MAKLKVLPEFLVDAMFGDTTPRPDVHIRGVTFDAIRQIVVLDIEGIDVPLTDDVNAIFTVQRKTVEFEPA